jgi:hypothetical protein
MTHKHVGILWYVLHHACLILIRAYALQLVLAPTRELALQIYEESQAFCKHMKMRVFPLVGGGGMKSIEEQGFQVRQVCQSCGSLLSLAVLLLVQREANVPRHSCVRLCE